MPTVYRWSGDPKFDVPGAMNHLSVELSTFFGETIYVSQEAIFDIAHPGEKRLEILSETALDDTTLDARLTAFPTTPPPFTIAGTPTVADGAGGTVEERLDIVDGTISTLTASRGGTGLTSTGSDGFVLQSSTGTWISAALSLASTSGTLPLNRGGTGATTQQGAANAVLPSQSGNSGKALYSDGTNVAWQSVPGVVDSGSGSDTADEFLSGAVASSLGWTSTVNGTSAQILANPATLAGANGYRLIQIGTAAGGRAAYSFEAVVGQAPYVQPWLTSTLTLDYRIYIGTLPTAADDFEIGLSLGLGATTNGDVWTNGVGARASFSGTANVWTLASRTAGADVASSVVAVPSGSLIAGWQWIRLVVGTVNTSAYFGATKAAALASTPATISSSLLTTTTALGAMVKARRIAITAGNRSISFEYFNVNQSYTTPR